MVEAILNRLQEMRLEYDERLAQVIGAETANRVVPPLAKHTTALIKALARAMR